jgi:hypothetical protein
MKDLQENIVKSAKLVIETYQKNKVKYSQSQRLISIDTKFADCSSTVKTILKTAEADHLLKANNTKAMFDEINQKGGTFRKENPQPGDLMMWGKHVTVVTQVGSNELQFAHMGNSGPRIAKIKIQNNKLDTESIWGAGGFIGFYTLV